jgi:hypothetical protein
MEDSDHEVQEISPPVLHRTRRKKYCRKILLELIDPIFCCRSKRKSVTHQMIDNKDDWYTCSQNLLQSMSQNVMFISFL